MTTQHDPFHHPKSPAASPNTDPFSFRPSESPGPLPPPPFPRPVVASIPSYDAQGMNFLAGFLIITCADSLVAEREEDFPVTPVTTRRLEGGARGSKNPPEARGGSGGAGGSGGRVGGGSGNLKGRDKGGKREKERVMHLTEEEAEVIEAECVDAMLGLVVLQGGVLSRDLCGLHSVRDTLGGEGREASLGFASSSSKCLDYGVVRRGERWAWDSRG